MATRYAHVNIIARDWRYFVSFTRKFRLRTVEHERDHHGAHIDATNMPGIRVQAATYVPGHGPNGPTIEIFTCSENGEDFLDL